MSLRLGLLSSELGIESLTSENPGMLLELLDGGSFLGIGLENPSKNLGRGFGNRVGKGGDASKGFRDHQTAM